MAGAAYGPLFERALTLAVELHRGQVRKGTDVPYVTHLLAVASLVGEASGSEAEVAAALLHDAVEDAGGRETLERIRDEIGEDVAAIVEGCSDADRTPKPPWRGRKEAYVEHLRRAPESVVLVSCADKLHNARAIVDDLLAVGPERLFARFRGGREGTLWYYRALLPVYRERRAPLRLLERLEAEVEAMERLAAGAGESPEATARGSEQR
jgi:(p)ppGpp synthase/HD superfamily hydrolase